MDHYLCGEIFLEKKQKLLVLILTQILKDLKNMDLKYQSEIKVAINFGKNFSTNMEKLSEICPYPTKWAENRCTRSKMWLRTCSKGHPPKKIKIRESKHILEFWGGGSPWNPWATQDARIASLVDIIDKPISPQ